MEKLQWIKELVIAEQKMEESGMIDMSPGFDARKILQEETIEYLHDLKSSFVEVCTAFNELKGSTIGKIKIYGISNTIADFMLFRNGVKLIFSATHAGLIKVSFSNLPQQFGKEKGATPDTLSDELQASWGAYGQLVWNYKGHSINLDFLIRYYMTQFVRESTR